MSELCAQMQNDKKDDSIVNSVEMGENKPITESESIGKTHLVASNVNKRIVKLIEAVKDIPLSLYGLNLKHVKDDGKGEETLEHANTTRYVEKDAKGKKIDELRKTKFNSASFMKKESYLFFLLYLNHLIIEHFIQHTLIPMMKYPHLVCWIFLRIVKATHFSFFPISTLLPQLQTGN